MKRQGWPGSFKWMLPILLFSFLLRIASLDAQSIWYDEAFFANVSSIDLPSLPGVILDVRVHPPLYFLILHFWLALGHGEFVLRALSAFAGVLTVAGMYALGTAVRARGLGVLCALALAISPFHIWYSQEVKMYSLIAVLALLSSYFLLRLLREDKLGNWLGYGISTLLAIYTHYFALFVMVAQMTCLTLLRRRYPALVGRWLVCAVIIGLLYAPWLAAIFLTGGFAQGSISWIAPAHPADLFWTIYDFGLGSTSDPTHPLNIAAALLIVAILVYVSVQLLSRRIDLEERRKLSLVWLWLFLPLVLVSLISLDWPLPQKRSIYMDRYLILVLPAFLVLVCYGISRIFRGRNVLGALVAIALLVPAALSTSSIYLDERYDRDQWRQAIAEIKRDARSGDILLARPHQHVVLYYYDLQDLPWYTVPHLDSKEELEAFLDDAVGAQHNKGRRIWTMIVCENANAHRFMQGSRERLLDKVAEDEVRAWLLQHCQLHQESVYNGIYLAAYGDM